MANMAWVDHQLALLERELRQWQLERVASAERPRPDEPAYAQARRELALIATRCGTLAPALRQLAGRRGLLALQAEQARAAPAGQRWQALQSVRDRDAALERRLRRADALRRQLVKAGEWLHQPPSPHDMVRGLQEVLSSLGEQADQRLALSEAMQLCRDRDVLRAPRDAVSAKDRAELLVLVLAAVVWLLRRQLR
jgi:hypothetical protein